MLNQFKKLTLIYISIFIYGCNDNSKNDVLKNDIDILKNEIALLKKENDILKGGKKNNTIIKTPVLKNNLDTSNNANIESKLGAITGYCGYPSDYIPDKLNVYAYNKKSRIIYKHSYYDRNNSNNYSISVPDGKYYVFCGFDKNIKNYNNKGFYTKSVLCGLGVNCNDHSAITVSIKNGKSVKGINPTDWYYYDELIINF